MKHLFFYLDRKIRKLKHFNCLTFVSHLGHGKVPFLAMNTCEMGFSVLVIPKAKKHYHFIDVETRGHLNSKDTKLTILLLVPGPEPSHLSH